MPVNRLAVITFLDGEGGNYPGQGLPGGPVYPGQGLPGGGFPGQGYPGQGLPPGGTIDNSLPPGVVTLPVFPFDPTIDNSLPGGPGAPDISLPMPGKKYIVKWLACKGMILVPDQGLPGGSGRPGQDLPEFPEPK